MAHRGDVLKLLRACLRSTQRCPSKEQEVMLQQYIRNRFNSERNLIEATKIQNAINAAWEEVQQMNYYHDLREAKTTSTHSPSAPTSPLQPLPNKHRTIVKIEQSRVDSRMVIINFPTSGVQQQGVAEVVDSLRHFGPLLSVRCGENLAEAVFKHSNDAEKSVMEQVHDGDQPTKH